ncbi:hypothetical protein GCM10010191_16030 [Actinomadura vinacea]|uniref:NAD(P)-dependent alcohol dehydrogenase n=1 Tax=Actinomadura vinacea TaxID=115336 RepID=A0ABN3ILL6_9ACTN
MKPPVPQAGELLVKVAASSVNGFDLGAAGAGTLGKIAVTVATTA